MRAPAPAARTHCVASPRISARAARPRPRTTPTRPWTPRHEPVSIEKRYLRPDGEVVWALCRGIVVRDASDEPSYIVTHFVDFTARKLAERREARAELRFERAFSDAPIGSGRRRLRAQVCVV